MKKIKTYIVYKTHMTSGLTDLYYVGRSKTRARKCFITRAEPFLLSKWVRPVRLIFASVVVDTAEYEDLLDECNVYGGDFGNLLHNLVYNSTWNEFDMVNEKTFELDFLPYLCRAEKINPIDLKVDGVLDKLIANQNNRFHKRLKKYLNKNF